MQRASKTCRAYLQLLINTILPEVHLVGLLYIIITALSSLNARCRAVFSHSDIKDAHLWEQHCPVHSLRVRKNLRIVNITDRWKRFATFHTAHCTGPTTSDGIWVDNHSVLWLCGFILTLIGR